MLMCSCVLGAHVTPIATDCATLLRQLVRIDRVHLFKINLVVTLPGLREWNGAENER